MDSFDPYLQWLGIRDAERPVNHYRLLGVELYESDPDVIQSAADRQMAHLRTFQNGPNADKTQRLLNEISEARLCLLDADQRASYDDQLRLKAVATAAQTRRPTPPPVEPEKPPAWLPQAPRGRSGRQADISMRPMLMGLGICLALALGLIGYERLRSVWSSVRYERRIANTSPTSTTDNSNSDADSASSDSSASSQSAEARTDTDASPGESSSPRRSNNATAGSTSTPTDGATDDLNANAPEPAPSTADGANERGSEPSEASDATQESAAGRELPTFERPAAPTTWEQIAQAPGQPFELNTKTPIGLMLAALAQRDLSAARGALISIQQNQALVISPRDLNDAKLILLACEQFWDAVDAGASSLAVGESMDVSGLTADIMEKGEAMVKLRSPSGKVKEFDTRRRHILPELALALAVKQMAARPAAWRLGATFFAIDHQGGNDRARRLAARAAERGFSATYLLRAIRRLSGSPPLDSGNAGVAPLTHPPSPQHASHESQGTPSPEEQQIARRTVLLPELATLKKHYPAEKWATELVKRAGAPKLTPAARYVLLTRAIQEAEETHDLDVAWTAIDRLERQHGVDGNELRFQFLQGTVRRLRGSKRVPFAERAYELAQISLYHDDYEWARRFADLMSAIGKAAGDKTFRKWITDYRSDIELVQQQYDELETEREILLRSPENQEAQARIDRFRVLVKGDFHAIGNLQNSPDPSLNELAQRELNAARSPAEQFDLGTAWFHYGRSLEALEKKQALRRAEFWIEAAEGNLGEEQRRTARAQLDEIVAVVGRKFATLDLTDLAPLASSVGFGKLGINENPSLKQTNVKELPELNGKPIDRFLWAPAPSSVAYLIPNDAIWFNARAYVNADTNDGVNYVVKLDGKPSYRQRVERGQRRTIRIKIPKGTRELELIAETNQNPVNDHAYWIDPTLRF